jgi:hypothetical protein
MNDAVRKKWRNDLLSDEIWEPDITRAANTKGITKGIYVIGKTTGLHGFMKPGKKCGSGGRRAAYEKIASDLAFEIGLNVPPAVLYYRTPFTPLQEEKVIISLCPDGSCYYWKDLAGIASQDATEAFQKILAIGSGIVALDAWLDNDDRHNKDNTIFAGEPYREAIFIDFCNTMDHKKEWNGGKYDHFPKRSLPDPFKTALDWNIVDGAINRIAGLSDDTIGDIVCRIPDDFLSLDDRNIICCCLAWRKDKLRESLAKWYPGVLQ